MFGESQKKTEILLDLLTALFPVSYKEKPPASFEPGGMNSL
jgi:hypothetical protein